MLKKTLLFIFAGIPGLFIFLSSSLALLYDILEGGTISYWEITILILLIPAGGALLLAGVGKLNQWMYLFVFLSFIVSIPLFGYISNKISYEGKGEIWILASGFISAIVYRIVKGYYDRHNK